jgi:hypothetical protein
MTAQIQTEVLAAVSAALAAELNEQNAHCEKVRSEATELPDDSSDVPSGPAR